jgi:hypothetical protein
VWGSVKPFGVLALFVLFLLGSPFYLHQAMAQGSCKVALRTPFRSLSYEKQLAFVEQLLRLNHQINSRYYSFWVRNPLMQYEGNSFVDGGEVRNLSPLDQVWNQFSNKDFVFIEKLYDSDVLEDLAAFTIPFDFGGLFLPSGKSLADFVRNPEVADINPVAAPHVSEGFRFQSEKIVWANGIYNSSPKTFGNHLFEKLEVPEFREHLQKLGFKGLELLDPVFRINGVSLPERYFNAALGTVFQFIRLMTQEFNFGRDMKSPVQSLNLETDVTFSNLNELLRFVSKRLDEKRQSNSPPPIVLISENANPGFFDLGGPEVHRLAKTGPHYGEPIYINSDVAETLSFHEVFRILLHELVHQLGVKDEELRLPDIYAQALLEFIRPLFSSREFGESPFRVHEVKLPTVRVGEGVWYQNESFMKSLAQPPVVRKVGSRVFIEVGDELLDPTPMILQVIPWRYQSQKPNLLFYELHNLHLSHWKESSKGVGLGVFDVDVSGVYSMPSQSLAPTNGKLRVFIHTIKNDGGQWTIRKNFTDGQYGVELISWNLGEFKRTHSTPHQAAIQAPFVVEEAGSHIVKDRSETQWVIQLKLSGFDRRYIKDLEPLTIDLASPDLVPLSHSQASLPISIKASFSDSEVSNSVLVTGVLHLADHLPSRTYVFERVRWTDKNGHIITARPLDKITFTHTDRDRKVKSELNAISDLHLEGGRVMDMPIPVNFYSPNDQPIFSFKIAHRSPLTELFLSAELLGSVAHNATKREEVLWNLLNPPPNTGVRTMTKSLSEVESLVTIELDLPKLQRRGLLNQIRLKSVFARDSKLEEKRWSLGESTALFIESP